MTFENIAITVVVWILILGYVLWTSWPRLKNWQERGVIIGGVGLVGLGTLAGVLAKDRALSLFLAVAGALIGASIGGAIGKIVDNRTQD